RSRQPARPDQIDHSAGEADAVALTCEGGDGAPVERLAEDRASLLVQLARVFRAELRVALHAEDVLADPEEPDRTGGVPAEPARSRRQRRHLVLVAVDQTERPVL